MLLHMTHSTNAATPHSRVGEWGAVQCTVIELLVVRKEWMRTYTNIFTMFMEVLWSTEAPMVTGWEEWRLLKKSSRASRFALLRAFVMWARQGMLPTKCTHSCSSLAQGHTSGWGLCGKIAYGVKPSLFTMYNFHNSEISIYWEKMRGYYFLDIPHIWKKSEEFESTKELLLNCIFVVQLQIINIYRTHFCLDIFTAIDFLHKICQHAFF
jgi:hypothetical protein